MKRYLLFVVVLVVLLTLAACSSSESKVASITVENVRANMTMPTDTGSFWMLITNNSDTDDALVGATVDGCGVIELHDMVMENDVMVMRPVAGGQIAIPAGQTVELKPGGLHVMCMQKAAPLALGTKVQIELEFANAGTITVEGEVVEPAMNSGGMNNN